MVPSTRDTGTVQPIIADPNVPTPAWLVRPLSQDAGLPPLRRPFVAEGDADSPLQLFASPLHSTLVLLLPFGSPEFPVSLASMGADSPSKVGPPPPSPLPGPSP